MPRNRLPVSTVIFMAAIPLLLMGGVILFLPDIAHHLFHQSKIDPRLIGGFLAGVGLMDIIFAAFFRMQGK